MDHLMIGGHKVIFPDVENILGKREKEGRIFWLPRKKMEFCFALPLNGEVLVLTEFEEFVHYGIRCHEGKVVVGEWSGGYNFPPSPKIQNQLVSNVVYEAGFAFIHLKMERDLEFRVGEDDFWDIMFI